MSVIVALIIGAIAGYLAGKVVRGFAFGWVESIVIGLIGAYLGNWAFNQLGIIPPAGVLGDIFVAFCGAVLLLFVLHFIRKIANSKIFLESENKYVVYPPKLWTFFVNEHSYIN